MVCKARDSVATREVPLEKNVELKCMQVNERKHETRMTKRGDVKQTDKIDMQCLDALDM